MSIIRSFNKMIPLLLFLGSVSLANASLYGLVIAENKTLMSINNPPIDIDVSRSGILALDPGAFANCASAKTLDLSDNSIKNLPKDVFSTLTNLEHLSLAGNDLDGEALERAFLNLPNLKSLNITDNPLSTTLENENFVGLKSSCEIYIGKSKNFQMITPLAFGKAKKVESKNPTVAKEVNNCTSTASDLIAMFDDERFLSFYTSDYNPRHVLNDEPYSDVGVKMCTDSASIKLVDFSNVTETLAPNCRSVLMNEKGTKLKISDDTITSFDSGWFRIRETTLNAIHLFPAAFENLTSDLLNDLPKNIRFFSLQDSQLDRLNSGVMVNVHLRSLDLSANLISVIEENAFAGMKLTNLDLGYNRLTSLDYAPTLPETLLSLNLENSFIAEIPDESFSRLKSLLVLNLNRNEIENLTEGSFRGLVSLEWLDLSTEPLQNLPPNIFRDLSRLRFIGLSDIQISELEKGVFNGLGCLTKMDLSKNYLTGIDEGSFDGLTDSLEELDLHYNEFKELPTGSFVGVPKFNLSLHHNKIRKIEKDAFDLPYLKDLDLHGNGLSTIEKGAMKNLGNLADEIQVRLGVNWIARLENGALAGLPSKAYVCLVENPLRVIQAGVFEDS